MLGIAFGATGLLLLLDVGLLFCYLAAGQVTCF
jgi:hypothetical protein